MFMMRPIKNQSTKYDCYTSITTVTYIIFYHTYNRSCIFKYLLTLFLPNKIYLNTDQYFLINMLVLFQNAVTFAQTIRIHEIPYIFRKPHFHVSHYCVFSFNCHMVSKPFLTQKTTFKCPPYIHK